MQQSLPYKLFTEKVTVISEATNLRIISTFHAKL